MTDIDILDSIDALQGRYDALLCDLWGCYHNGVAPYPAAVAALQRWRKAGGAVILLTNAPRPNPAVAAHLASMGAPSDSFDRIVTSGDSTRAALADRRFGERIHVVGPERDATIWEGLGLDLVGVDAADAILCTGLFDDETETPEDYADLVARGVARGLPFLCANPDIVVDRGEERLWCAGAIAEAYKAAGGVAHYFGKPHGPIYELALSVARELRPDLSAARVLAVGDGVGTDVKGAGDAGLACVFVSGGLAAREVGADPERPERDRLTAYLEKAGQNPAYAIGRLR